MCLRTRFRQDICQLCHAHIAHAHCIATLRMDIHSKGIHAYYILLPARFRNFSATGTGSELLQLIAVHVGSHPESRCRAGIFKAGEATFL